mgnify:CR=1 FL=1
MKKETLWKVYSDIDGSEKYFTEKPNKSLLRKHFDLMQEGDEQEDWAALTIIEVEIINNSK